jgi:hypothetical protein
MLKMILPNLVKFSSKNLLENLSKENHSSVESSFGSSDSSAFEEKQNRFIEKIKTRQEARKKGLEESLKEKEENFGNKKSIANTAIQPLRSDSNLTKFDDKSNLIESKTLSKSISPNQIKPLKTGDNSKTNPNLTI